MLNKIVWHQCVVFCSLVLTIVQSLSGSLPFQTRNVRFLSSVFDASGDRFLAADHHGNIYLFDMQSNR